MATSSPRQIIPEIYFALRLIYDFFKLFIANIYADALLRLRVVITLRILNLRI